MPSYKIGKGVYISIHAPRMGSDEYRNRRIAHGKNFNPRSPHGERLSDLESGKKTDVFQSTLPAWGATTSRRLSYYPLSNFNPRSPHGERPSLKTKIAYRFSISIHAPRMGSDSTVKAYSNDRIKWSTLREPHFLYSKNACFSPIVSMCAATSRTKNQRIRVSFGSYPGLAPTCFTLDWYRFPRL